MGTDYAFWNPWLLVHGISLLVSSSNRSVSDVRDEVSIGFELHFVWPVIGIPRLLMMGQSGISYYESAGIRSTHALEVGLVLNGCI